MPCVFLRKGFPLQYLMLLRLWTENLHVANLHAWILMKISCVAYLFTPTNPSLVYPAGIFLSVCL